jgi:hypothetical protein
VVGEKNKNKKGADTQLSQSMKASNTPKALPNSY